MKAPNKIYGPLLANLMQKMAKDIKKDCGASSVRIQCEFVFVKGKGDLNIQTFTSADAKTERMLDPDKPLPRGSKLQYDVGEKLRAVYRSITKALGGE